MKILVVSSYLPYPLFNGGNIRLYNLIKLLHTKHEVTLICEKRPHQTEADIKELEKICQNVITIPRKRQWGIENVLKSGFSTNSFLITGHTLSQMREAIKRELQSEKYDLIHVETFYVLQNVPQTSLPIVLVEHNIEYLVYKRYTDKAPFPLRPLLRLDVQKIKRAEEASWKRAAAVATVSEIERKMITNPQTFVVANGVDTASFTFKSLAADFKTKDKKILYIGDYQWIQNRDAAEYIIREVWPEIRSKINNQKLKFNVKLWIVGRNMPESLKDLGKDDVTIIFDDNNPKSTPEIFSEADLLLAPKRVGGGTSYKTLEAMAVGTPVVINSFGLEGLDITRNEDVLVGDTPEDLADATVRLLTDKEKYIAIRQHARKTIEQTYDWSMIAASLEKVYTSAVK